MFSFCKKKEKMRRLILAAMVSFKCSVYWNHENAMYSEVRLEFRIIGIRERIQKFHKSLINECTSQNHSKETKSLN